MLRQVAEGVLVHESEFLQSNTVVVQGADGVLLIDPGIRTDEIACLASDLRELGLGVVAGFSTHPHWDHLLWHADLGSAPRYGTARAAADVEALLSDASWKDRVAEALPPELAGQIGLDRFGLISGLPAERTEVPWDGPRVRIIEHQAHAPGHAALLIEERGVLVAGDMLSDVLIPFLDLEAADPVAEYRAALELFEEMAADVDVLVPGHGSVGGGAQFRDRMAQDHAYLGALGEAGAPTDPRLDPSAPNGEWLPDVHDWQQQQITERGAGDGEPS